MDRIHGIELIGEVDERISYSKCYTVASHERCFGCIPLSPSLSPTYSLTLHFSNVSPTFFWQSDGLCTQHGMLLVVQAYSHVLTLQTVHSHVKWVSSPTHTCHTLRSHHRLLHRRGGLPFCAEAPGEASSLHHQRSCFSSPLVHSYHLLLFVILALPVFLVLLL